VVREAIDPEGYSNLSARLRPDGQLVHIVHVVVRVDAGGVVVVMSAENGPAEAISVVVWSVMAVKSRPGHRRHGLDRHLVDAWEAGRPEEVGDPDMERYLPKVTPSRSRVSLGVTLCVINY
jgi:hypothetical protein